MKTVFLACILSLVVCCTFGQKPGSPLANPQDIIKNGGSWSIYYRDHLRLWDDFTAFDQHDHKITKLQFLTALTSAKYLPLHLAAPWGTWSYKLYPLNGHRGKDLGGLIAQNAQYLLADYKVEGTKLPPFKFTDLNGNTYTNASTKGKILVLKSWFINCLVCNEEMPELDKLVDSYKNRKDVLFVSIAYDTRDKLIAFNKHKGFKYAIASVPENFIEQIIRGDHLPHPLVS